MLVLVCWHYLVLELVVTNRMWAVSTRPQSNAMVPPERRDRVMTSLGVVVEIWDQHDSLPKQDLAILADNETLLSMKKLGTR